MHRSDPTHDRLKALSIPASEAKPSGRSGPHAASILPRPSLFLACGRVLTLLTLATLVGCTPPESKVLLQPSHALGAVLAEEAANAAGAKTQIALILPDANWGPASVVEEALKAELKKRGVSTVTAKSADLGDPMRRGPIGLRAADFFEAMEKAADAGAVVSLAGAPRLKPGEASRLSPKHPPVLVVATASLGNVLGVASDHRQLASLVEAKIIQLAIVDTAPELAPPPSDKADATHQLFSQHYRILRRPD